MKKELPISTQSDINGHLIYTYPYSILKAFPVYEEYLMEHYLLCFGFVSKSDDITFEYEDGIGYDNMFHDSGPFDILFYPYSVGLGIDLRKNIISAIDNGYYPVVFTDEYYLKSRPMYKKTHMRHEILITGYNRTSFHYYAFDDKFRLSFSSFPQANLRKAYRKGSELEVVESLSWVPGRSIIFMKPKDAQSQYHYSPERFRNSLKMYLDADFSPLLDAFFIPKEDCFCGVENTKLIKYALNNPDREILIRYPAVHAWCESKRNTQRKIAYYLENSRNISNGMLDDYEKQVVKPAEIVRMVVLKLRRNGRINSPDTIRLLESIADSEKKIIKNIINLR